METKVCKECGQSLPISNFSKNKATKDGLANYCKKCDKERRRKSSGGITQQGVKATLKMSDFDDNMLFAELRRRGYTGELRYSKVVNIYAPPRDAARAGGGFRLGQSSEK